MSESVARRLDSHPMKIHLVSPRGPLYRHRGGIWKRSLRYAPLTLAALASLVPDDVDADVTIADEGIDEIDTSVEADVVGISAITGTAPRAYEIARAFRERNVPVVLGGVHPTLVPDEAAAHADSVVVGYAEATWPRLLRDLRDGRLRDRYVQSASHSLAGLRPFRRDLLPRRRYMAAHTTEATRGCVYQCEFCVVPAAWGRPIQRPVGEVVAEIAASGAKTVIFLDLNIVADGDYAKALFEALVPLGIRWGGLVTTTLAWDDELLDLAARSGCRGVLVGFESLSHDSLLEMRKAFNARRDYRFVVEQFHERRIAVMGCFVFGFDHDDRTVFEETAAFVAEAKIDLPRFAVLVPFPGTPLFRRLERENRILTRNWELYDGQHVVFEPARMSPGELLAGTERAWLETYKIGSIARRLAGSRTQLAVSVGANLGYRYYAKRLHRYYTCDWMVGAS